MKENHTIILGFMIVILALVSGLSIYEVYKQNLELESLKTSTSIILEQPIQAVNNVIVSKNMPDTTTLNTNDTLIASIDTKKQSKTPTNAKETKKELTNKLPEKKILTADKNEDLEDIDKNIAIKGVEVGDGRFDIYRVNLKKSDIRFYHRSKTEILKNIKNLKNYLNENGRKLIFATNGGMFEQDLTPTGLYVSGGKEIFPLNLKKGGPGFENFYDLQPNGVFYVKENNTSNIVTKEKYKNISGVKYATQSGPLLIINGEINKILNKNSTSKHIRSGVGIKANGEVVFAISQNPVTFYNFARIFKYYGCKHALYLDGVVSEMYLPEIQRTQTKNDFALMITVTEKK